MREVCAGPFLKKTYKIKGLLCAGALLHYEKYKFCYQKLRNDYAQYEFKIVMASAPNKPTKILLTPCAFQGFASIFLQLFAFYGSRGLVGSGAFYDHLFSTTFLEDSIALYGSLALGR